jgi:hypothetical protein
MQTVFLKDLIFFCKNLIFLYVLDHLNVLISKMIFKK